MRSLARTLAPGPAPESDVANARLPHENIYGHLNRVHWFRRHIRLDDSVLEVGCGTGFRVTLPLHIWGYTVLGIDIDHASIAAGRQHLAQAGFDPDLLRECKLDEVDGAFDVIIVSEVLEHLQDDELASMLVTLRAKLKPQGRLLVTVPNGYGWFEAESFVWHKAGLGFLLTYSGVAPLIRRLRIPFASGPTFGSIPSSLSSGPHVQRFSLAGIEKTLVAAGFDVTDSTGSVLACGPITDMLLTGFASVMALNCRLGSLFPKIAAGFYLAAIAQRDPKTS
jgi:SAM-dependent methyltransferase